jgi:hypothetical protein
VTEACAGPFESVTWLAALQVVTGRCGGDPARLAPRGPEEFTAVVRAAVPAWGGKNGWGKICGHLIPSSFDPARTALDTAYQASRRQRSRKAVR